MTWWQWALVAWGAGSFLLAFVVARFLRAPSAPLPRPRLQAEPAPPARPDEPVAPPVGLTAAPDVLAPRSSEQVA